MSRALFDGMVLSGMRIATRIPSTPSWKSAGGLGDESVDSDVAAVSGLWAGGARLESSSRNREAIARSSFTCGLDSGFGRGDRVVWDREESSVASVSSVGAGGDARFVAVCAGDWVVLRPFGADSFAACYPWLTSWALFFRRFAAVLRAGLAAGFLLSLVAQLSSRLLSGTN